MTFGDVETSTHDGKPFECYRFQSEEGIWNYTSADRQITIPQGTFDPETISRGEASFSREDTSEELVITVARDNPVPAPYIGTLPSTPLLVTVYRGHRGDEANARIWFSGNVQRIRPKGSEIELVCQSVLARLNRDFPPLTIQLPCNHVLFQGGCDADPVSSRDLVTVTTVDGVTITSNDFGLRADQWFRGGRLSSLDGKETRFIGDHVGNVVTLISPMPGLVSGDQVYAFWGCPRTESACSGRFGVLPSHLGFARIPDVNPYREGR